MTKLGGKGGVRERGGEEEKEGGGRERGGKKRKMGRRLWLRLL